MENSFAQQIFPLLQVVRLWQPGVEPLLDARLRSCSRLRRMEQESRQMAAYLLRDSPGLRKHRSLIQAYLKSTFES